MHSKHNRNLDILRGAAALVVVLFHLISTFPTVFDKNFAVGSWLHFNFPGHMGVLVFFILSGYVIAINTPRLTDKKSIGNYARKRIVRIVPIYLMAVLFTVSITAGKYHWPVILSNLFFVSVPFDNVIQENSPLWSLNYELLYYLAFVFFSFFNISFAKVVKWLSIIIAALFVFFHNVAIYPLVIGYLVGFLFWSTGAMIAEVRDWKFWDISGSRLLAIFLLMFCLQPLNPYGPLLKILHIHTFDYSAWSWFQQSISYSDIYYYPLTILLILSLTHSYTPKYCWLLYFLYISALVRLCMLFVTYDLAFIVQEHYVAPAIILISSIALWFANFQLPGAMRRAIMSTSSLGGISYGIYIIHFPLVFLFGMLGAYTGILLALKLVVFFVALFGASWLLEMQFQPLVRKAFRKP